MPWHTTPDNFFLWYGAAHGHAQEPTPGSAVEFLGESVRKNRPLVPRSNIAGSWARGGGGGYNLPSPTFLPHCACVSPGSAGWVRADPDQPKKHLIACGRTQGNLQHWFGSAAVQQNIDER